MNTQSYIFKQKQSQMKKVEEEEEDIDILDAFMEDLEGIYLKQYMFNLLINQAIY